ncbi:hypothetical protein GQ42DRAFT_157476 [Ramicandelaber brevisporus]|nr:hypothetical protein GQ42DRAFT_157476 [Ramicandelaber brevisporus]
MALQQCVSESGIVGIDDTHVADLAAHLLHLCEWSSAMGISQLHSHSANAGIVILQQWSQQQQQQQQQQHRSPTPETGSRRTPSRVVQFISNLDSIRIQFHVEAARACIDVGNGDAKQHIQAAQAVDDSSSLTIDPAALAALHTAAALQSVYNSSVEQAQEFIRAAKDIMSQIDADSSADGTADAPPSNGRRNPPAAPRAARSRNRSTAVSTGRAVGWCNIHYIESLVACRLGNLDGAIGCVMRGCALLKACIESTARHDAQRRRRFDELRKRQSRSGSHRSSPQTLFNSDDNDNDNGNDAEGDVFSNTAAAPSDANPALLAQLVQEQESAADSSTKQLQQKKAELDACSSHPLCRLAFDLFSLAGALMATFGLAGDAEYALQTGLSMAHAANSTVWIQRLSLSLANLCTRRGHWAKADELLGGLQLVDGSVEHALWLVFKARLIFNRSDIEQTLEDYAHTVDGALAAIGSLIQSVGSDGSESTMASSLTALHECVCNRTGL